MLQSRCHIIATVWSKQGYLLTEKDGKMVPVKIGLKGIQRDNLNYELTLLLEIDQPVLLMRMFILAGGIPSVNNDSEQVRRPGKVSRRS